MGFSADEVGDDRRSSLEDADLLLRIGRDDVTAFERLYQRWATRVAAFCYERVGDWEAAADLVAETFAVVWRRRKRFEDRGVPGAAWLFGIAAREVGRHRRRIGVERRALDKLGVQVPRWDEESMRRVEEMVDATRLSGLLDGALQSLSEGERRAVELRILGDLTYAEAAEELGCSQGAVRVRIYRALGKLRRGLDGALVHPRDL